MMRAEIPVQQSLLNANPPRLPPHPFGTLSVRGWHLEEPPEPDWIIEGLLHQGTINLLDGIGSSGKSILALQLAISISAEIRWLAFPTLKPGPVLYLNAEDPDGENHRRYIRLLKSLQLSAEQQERLQNNLSYSSLSELDINPSLIDEKGNTTDVYRHLKQLIGAVKPVLLILDPLVFFSEADENSNSAARRLYTALRQLKTTVLCVHHMSKAAMNGEVAQRAKSRGSSVFTENARTRMSLENGVLTVDKNNFGQKYEGDNAIHLILECGAWRIANFAEKLETEDRKVRKIRRGNHEACKVNPLRESY